MLLSCISFFSKHPSNMDSERRTITQADATARCEKLLHTAGCSCHYPAIGHHVEWAFTEGRDSKIEFCEIRCNLPVCITFSQVGSARLI